MMAFAAGLAAGYLLGRRAGRERYEQIMAGLGALHGHPMVQEAQQAAKELFRANEGTGSQHSNY